jgi:hypothetical protein
MRHLEFDDERSRELVFDAVTVVRSLEELEAILLADPRSHRAFVDRFTDGQFARWLNAIGEFSRGSSVEQARRLSSRARNTAWKARVGKVFSDEAVAKLSASDVLGEVLTAKLVRKADAGAKVGLHRFRRHLEYNTPVAKPASRRPQKRRARKAQPDVQAAEPAEPDIPREPVAAFEPSVLCMSGGVTIETMSELRTFAVSSLESAAETVSATVSGRLSKWLRAIGEPSRASAIAPLDLPGDEPLTEVATILARLVEKKPAKRRASKPASAATVPATGAAPCVASTLPSAASCPNQERPKAAWCGHHTVFEPSVLRVSGGVTVETMSELRTFAVSSYQNAREIVSIAAAGRLSNWLCAIGEPERAALIRTLDLPGIKPLTEISTILERLQVTNDAHCHAPRATSAATPVVTASAPQRATDSSTPSPTPRPKPPPVPGRPHTAVEPSVLTVKGGVTIETISELRTFAVSSYQNAEEIVSVAMSGRLSNWLRAVGEPARAEAIETLNLNGANTPTALDMILDQLQVNSMKPRTRQPSLDTHSWATLRRQLWLRLKRSVSLSRSDAA